MGKDFKTIKEELSKPFAPEDLEWRLQITSKDGTNGLAVPYVTNRAIQDRLDDTVGPENWHNDFKPWHGNGKKDAQICGISIYNEARGDWITKWDGAEDTDIEAVKGGLSDSMKRASVQWGIGRILYKMDGVWVEVEQKGKTTVIKPAERGKLDAAYINLLSKLHLSPAPAGGVQSELMPTPNAEEKPAQQPKAAPKPAAQQNAPKPVYLILKATVERGMNSTSTRLTLQTPEGKTINAFARGADDALYQGAQLIDVKLVQRKQNAVFFYLLESYKAVKAMPKAA